MSTGAAQQRLTMLAVRAEPDVAPDAVDAPRALGPRWARLLSFAASAWAVGLLVGGPGWSLAWVVVAVAVSGLLHRLTAAADYRRQQRSAAALAPCADLLAACLHAGADPQAALASVARTLEGPLQEPLSRVVAALGAGADPAQAWALSAQCEALAPIARAFVRASRSGAPLAATMSTVADEQRRIRRWQAEEAARKAGVLAVAPLVLCFLPAFILIGVVPVIVGVAAQALAGQ